MFDPETVAVAQNLRFDGIDYAALPATNLEPAGTYQGAPYWLFGDGQTRIFGVKELPNGSYGGFTGSGVSWSAGRGIAPYRPVAVSPVEYVAPGAVNQFGLSINPMDAQLLFSGSGNFGGDGGGSATSSDASAPRITSGAAGANAWLWIALIAGAILLFGDHK